MVGCIQEDIGYQEQAPMKNNKVLRAIFSPENLLAFALAAILVALVIVTADSSPTWIYQGF